MYQYYLFLLAFWYYLVFISVEIIKFSAFCSVISFGFIGLGRGGGTIGYQLLFSFEILSLFPFILFNKGNFMLIYIFMVENSQLIIISSIIYFVNNFFQIINFIDI